MHKYFERLDGVFENLGYSRISYNDGFFYYDGSIDVAIYFNLVSETVIIAEYETGKSIDVDSKVINAIYYAIRILGW